MLRVRDISKSYGSAQEPHHVLDRVSLTVGDEECVALIGSSGSGKSTLASIIIGLEPADEGTVEFDGVFLDPCQKARKRSKEQRASLLEMQMIFQHPASSFSEQMKIGRGIIEGIAYHPGFNKKDAHKQMLEALDMVGLPSHFEQKHANELSGGECQRAAIARAIISRPKLLICDEPTSALDVTVQASIINLLVTLQHELSFSYLFISHDLALVRGFCDRAYVMDKGRIVEEGQVAQLFKHPQSDAAKRLLSSVLYW